MTRIAMLVWNEFRNDARVLKQAQTLQSAGYLVTVFALHTPGVTRSTMNRLEYSQFRGWELPADENGADQGLLVEYVDGGKANTAEYAGYVSWSPKGCV